MRINWNLNEFALDSTLSTPSVRHYVIMVLVVVVIMMIHVFYSYFTKALTFSDFVNKPNRLMSFVLYRARVLLCFS